MKIISLILIFILNVCFFNTLSGQNLLDQDSNESGSGTNETKSVHSPDSAFVSYFYLNESGVYKQFAVSKPLIHFEDYDPARKYNNLYVSLGNIGSAVSSVVPEFNISPDFTYRTDAFELYKMQDDSIRIYNSQGPFSHLDYYLGPAKEQRIKATLSQRIGSGIYLGLDARFSNSPGSYIRQRSLAKGSTFYAAFLHPNKRYGAFITFRTDRLANYENGGLENTAIFTSNQESNRKVIKVNLSNAMNRSKNSGLVVQQYFNILSANVARKIDTAIILVPRKFDAGRFVHTFTYSRITQTYEDKAPPADFYSFYPSYFVDSLPVYDSVFHSRIENSIAYSNEVPDTLGNSFPLQYTFGIRFQTDRIIRDTIYNDLYSQVVPYGTLKGVINKKTIFKANAFLVLGGYKSGDFAISGSFHQFIGETGHKLYLNVIQGMSHPDYFWVNHLNENYKWDHAYVQQNISKAEAGIILKGFDLQAAYSLIKGYTYFNEEVKPVQYLETISLISANMTKEIHLKHWFSSIYVTIQKALPDSVIQVPLIAGKASFGYDGIWFKKALHIQFGVTATYHSQWYQDAWMPALRSFYRQNTYLAGNYPYLDVFVNMNIKRARLFAKYEHFNASFMPHTYIIVPGYPQADAAFKFGVSWLFFD